MDDYSHRINAKNRPIITIGDTHWPYGHIDYLDFIRTVHDYYADKSKLKPTVIHIGDEVDGHSISFHKSESSLWNPDRELEKAIEEVQEWKKYFPKMLLVESNHGSLIYRRFKDAGIPLRHLVPLDQLYDVPRWSWHHDILADTTNGPVYFCHGKKAASGGLAKEMGVSCVQGHYHGKLEVVWAYRVGHKRFNAFTGCGIDWQSMAYVYGKNNVPKPILGCLAINENGMPYTHHMMLNKKGRWNGKI